MLWQLSPINFVILPRGVGAFAVQAYHIDRLRQVLEGAMGRLRAFYVHIKCTRELFFGGVKNLR